MINTRLILAIIALAGILQACKKGPKQPEITVDELKNHIGYLASDSLKGRYPGTAESALAAKYIQTSLADVGLKPLYQKGYQTFDLVTACELSDTNFLTTNDSAFKLERDFMPLAFTFNGLASSDGVFIGFGFEIETDSLQWNDYALADVKGKWVMMLRNDPEQENPHSRFLPYASDRAKVILAQDKGAAGVLLVNGINSNHSDEVLPLSYDQNLSRATIPVISITRKTANALLSDDLSIETLEQTIIEKKQSVVVTIKKLIEAKTNVSQTKATATNVAFEIKAKSADATDRYIVIGAHYDHLGMGGQGVNSRSPDTIAAHNGADDNASGTAGIIELAGYLASKANELKQNIIVVAFDAEEMGVLGSKYFVQNLPVDKSKITAMLNFDMIGRFKHDTIGIVIGGTGTASEFDSLLNNQTVPFKVAFSADGYGPSDHAPFYTDSIPVLFFSTGAHSEYHTPADDVDKINYEGEVKVLQYASNIALQLASTANGLTFKSTGSPTGKQQRARLKVTLGIIPDYAGVHSGGLTIDAVRPGGPAAKSGMLKGDVIIAINGMAVTNIYEYMARLSKLKPETTASVEVLRNGEKQIILVQL